MIIVGFDPGLATLGYGVIKTEKGKKPQMLEDSSITAHSLSHFKHFAIADVVLKSNLYKSKEII